MLKEGEVFERTAMLYLYAETPLHAGSGTSLGIVDLPIQRERITGYPLVQASGLKGCLREQASQHKRWCGDQDCPLSPHDDWDRRVSLVFGPAPNHASEYAGAISVGDARILLFPVRSLKGVFAWVTSKQVLARFRRDASLAVIEVNWGEAGPRDEEEALVAPENDVLIGNSLVLEEFAFKSQESEDVRKIGEWLARNSLPGQGTYWQQALPRRLVILGEEPFRDFTQFATDIITRTHLQDETKTVKRGALWSEEQLPAETLLYAPLFATRPRANPLPDLEDASAVVRFIKACVDGRHIQLGGDATVGRGFAALRLQEGGAQ